MNHQTYGDHLEPDGWLLYLIKKLQCVFLDGVDSKRIRRCGIRQSQPDRGQMRVLSPTG